MSGLLVVSSAHKLPLASATFHACVTSPPYYGLREYHGSQVIKWPGLSYLPQPGALPVEYPEWRGSLGAEPTSEMYIGHMVRVCREIKRVLRIDGTFWLNMGDSYNGSGGAGGDYGPGGIRDGQPKYSGRNDRNLQAGDLMMIPARLALALQASGWILRNDNIWAKHPMPEPRIGWRYERPPCPCVTERREMHIQHQMAEQGVDRHRIFDKAGTKFEPDPDCNECHGSGRYGPHKFRPGSWRHTRSHEFVFQFVKKMGYYSNSEIIKMPLSVATIERAQWKHSGAFEGQYKGSPGEDRFPDGKPLPPGYKTRSSGANPRSVLTPSRTNYSGKHFAVYPPLLIAPFVHASVPKQCCSGCGKPWAPVIEDKTVIEYRATCECSITNDEQPRGGPRPPVPGLVLDPFMGSGTTGLVAREFGVDFVGCDISFQYLDEQAKVRTNTGQPSGALSDLPLFNLEDAT